MRWISKDFAALDSLIFLTLHKAPLKTCPWLWVGWFCPATKLLNQRCGITVLARGNFTLINTPGLLLLQNSWRAGYSQALQLNQAAHVASKVIQSDPSLGTCQPNAAYKRSAHIVTLSTEDVFHTRPSLRTDFVPLYLSPGQRLVAMDPALQTLLS